MKYFAKRTVIEGGQRIFIFLVFVISQISLLILVLIYKKQQLFPGPSTLFLQCATFIEQVFKLFNDFIVDTYAYTDA